jgi:hypothetical protein
MIGELIDCDLYEIEAADPYPESYDRTVDRNRREQADDARPGIANPLPDVSRYDTVLVGSPVWGSRAPARNLTNGCAPQGWPDLERRFSAARCGGWSAWRSRW